MITIRGLRKRLGEREVLAGIDAEVAEGAIVALVGQSGSGKTTLLRCLNGLDTFDAGSIRIAGHELSAGPSRRLSPRLRADVGLVFQEYHLFPHLSVLDNVTLAARVVGKVPRAEAEARGHAFLERVGLRDRDRARPSQLSGGEKQRVALARALAQGARVLLLDEPTSALDAENRDDVRALLLDTVRSASDRPLTLLIVTHDRGFASAIADEVWSLERGQLSARSLTSQERPV
jgi:ABC-type polar amino acid transport system ATPase subunit